MVRLGRPGQTFVSLHSAGFNRRQALLGLLALAAPLPFAGCRCGSKDCEAGREPISSADHPNPAAVENQKPGSASWQLTNPAANREIEGYASATSVNRGESISFFVNTSEAAFDLEIFRMGWYGGAGARAMTAPRSLPGAQQPVPQADPDTGLIECQWAESYTLTVPAEPDDWASGVYLVKLTGSDSGKQSYIIFVVRDDERKSDLLFQSSVNTYEAYNDWGGQSLYSKPRAFKVSFNRPYTRGHGSGDFLRWEYNMVRFLEREGYDVTYSTDVDTHVQAIDPLSHNGFLIVGHDEYWTWQMRQHVREARNSGVSLGFFGANACFWQNRYEHSPATNAPHRTLVCYKTDAYTKDPDYTTPGRKHLTTVTWRNPPLNQPEADLVGVMYDWNLGSPNTDMVIHDASHWVFKGTGLHDGDRLAGLVGYEADRIAKSSPCNTELLAHSPCSGASRSDGEPKEKSSLRRAADMTVYTSLHCGVVLATGTMQWNWGLDDFGPDHRALANSAVQQATRNILKRFGAIPASPPAAS